MGYNNFVYRGAARLRPECGKVKGKNMTKIAASILSADFADLKQDCLRLLREGVDLLHFDVMDGHFVPNISYGAPVLESLHAALPDAFYDVHLMISDPARYAPDFARAGAGLITFHLEAVPGAVPRVIETIREAGCRVGLSIRPGTPVAAVFPYLEALDLVLVMSVEPGFGGQAFMPEAVQRLAALDAERRRRNCRTLLEVDGGINAQTGPLCAQAGADWLVAGSALFRAPDPAPVIRLLHGEA